MLSIGVPTYPNLFPVNVFFLSLYSMRTLGRVGRGNLFYYLLLILFPPHHIVGLLWAAYNSRCIIIKL